MWKDIVFCIIMILVIIILDSFIQGYIKESVEEMTMKLNNLKQEVIEKEDKINDIDTIDIKNAWEGRDKILATVIEHDELEKVKKNLTGLYSALQSKEKSEAISEIDESIFILNHIKEKYSFKIENVI